MKALLLLPLLAAAADTWQPFAVDGRVTVHLPGQPTELDLTKLTRQPTGHLRYWVLRTPAATYQVLRQPTSDFRQGLPPIMRTDTTARRLFYRGLIGAVMQDEQGHVLAQTTFTTAAGSGVEVKYRGLHQGTGKRVISYLRSVVADSVSYSLLFLPTDKADTLGLAEAGPRRRFFNSITVKP